MRVTRPAVDPDGDAVTYRYEWSLNGSVLPQARQARLGVPLKKRDVVRVQVTPWDGELAGSADGGQLRRGEHPAHRARGACSSPATPTALSGISVKIQGPATDVDGDAITYRYRWSRDGLPFALDGATLPPGSLRRGEVWRVEITAFDGDEAGEPLVLTATVANTVPPAPVVTLEPAEPVTGASLTCGAVVPERDADQEPITVGYRWSRDDRPEPAGRGAAGPAAGA